MSAQLNEASNHPVKWVAPQYNTRAPSCAIHRTQTADLSTKEATNHVVTVAVRVNAIDAAGRVQITTCSDAVLGRIRRRAVGPASVLARGQLGGERISRVFLYSGPPSYQRTSRKTMRRGACVCCVYVCVGGARIQHVIAMARLNGFKHASKQEG